MDKRGIARELLRLAKELVAGTWSLPNNPRDVDRIVKMVSNMRRGKPPLPGKTDVGSAFYRLLGDDDLYDRFDSELEWHKREGYGMDVYYQTCADLVRDRVKEFVKQNRKDFRSPTDYNMLVELSKRL